MESLRAPERLARALEAAREHIVARFAQDPKLQPALTSALSRPDEVLADWTLQHLIRLGLLEGEQRPYRPGSPALAKLLVR